MIVSFSRLGRFCRRLALVQLAFGCLSPLTTHTAQPAISSVTQGNNSLVISATLPSGFHHAVLEAGGDLYAPLSEPVVSGGLDGNPAIVTFRVPSAGGLKFFRVRVGPETTVPPATYSGSAYFSVE